MKYIPLKFIKEDPSVNNADSAADAKESTALLEQQANDLHVQLAKLSPGSDPLRRADLLLALGRVQIRLEKMRDAWHNAREAFDIYAAERAWQGAVEACDVLFASDQAGSLAALGHGIWLAITYPIDPELTVAMMKHVVDETPPESDGAAVAAVTAHFIVDLRSQGDQRENLLLFTNQLLATVARRHGAVDGQADFDKWVERLELNDPDKFLPRLSSIVDVIVQDDWWIDRDALRAELPVH